MDPLAKPFFRLVAGLGNPGREYANTRHNVGFLLCDRIAGKRGFEFRFERKWNAEVAQHEGVLYCKPMTFMNRSGTAVRAVADYYKVQPCEVLTVYDDLALPLGRMRFRPDGSSGGHNGMQSIIEHFGTPRLARLRIGIGAAADANGTRTMVDHVLGTFAPQERETLDGVLDRSMEALECARSEGIAAAMNRFNPA